MTPPLAFDAFLRLPAFRVFGAAPAVADAAHDLDVVHRIVEAWIDEVGARAALAQASRRTLWAMLPAPTTSGDASIRVRLPEPAGSEAEPVERPQIGGEYSFWLRFYRRFARDRPESRGPRYADKEAKEAAAAAHLASMAPKAGFDLVETRSLVPAFGYVRKRRKRGEWRFAFEGDCVAQGVLRVRDAQALAHALVAGIGPSKAYGFGMLVLGKI